MDLDVTVGVEGGGLEVEIRPIGAKRHKARRLTGLTFVAVERG